MILTKEQQEQFKKAATPLIEFLNSEGFHPHLKVIVDYDSAEILEASVRVVDDSFIKD
jgi:hypothetical protein